jgi:5-methylthioribose kinase
MAMDYYSLSTETVPDYVRSRPELRQVFHDGDDIEATEVGDGNLNLVFKVWAKSDPKRTVVLKQALPYVRLVGDSWPLPKESARFEAQALEIHYRHVPQHTPKVYFMIQTCISSRCKI